MLAPPLSEGPADVRAARALASWINQHHQQVGGMQVRAGLGDAADADGATLAVEMHGAAGLIATYKCGISCTGGRRDWLVLAPLVVMWNGTRPEGSGGLGLAMIGHLVSVVRAFQAGTSARGTRVLIASGNLTRAKGGRSFFESLGWEIVVPALRSPRHLCDRRGEAAALAMVEAQIERAIAPLLAAGKIEAEPVSFAVLALP